MVGCEGESQIDFLLIFAEYLITSSLHFGCFFALVFIELEIGGTTTNTNTNTNQHQTHTHSNYSYINAPQHATLIQNLMPNAGRCR